MLCELRATLPSMGLRLTSRKLYLAASSRKLERALLAGVITVFLQAVVPVGLQAQTLQDYGDAAQLTDRMRSEDQDAARSTAREIRRLWSRSGSASADLLLKRGRDALRAKNYDVAIEHLTALTDHAPDFAEGFHQRANAYFQADLLGPAIEDLGHVIALNPLHFDAIQGLGAIFEQIGDYERAYTAYQEVLSIHPHHARVIEALKRVEPHIKGPAL